MSVFWACLTPAHRLSRFVRSLQNYWNLLRTPHGRRWTRLPSNTRSHDGLTPTPSVDYTEAIITHLLLQTPPRAAQLCTCSLQYCRAAVRHDSRCGQKCIHRIVNTQSYLRSTVARVGRWLEKEAENAILLKRERRVWQPGTYNVWIIRGARPLDLVADRRPANQCTGLESQWGRGNEVRRS